MGFDRYNTTYSYLNAYLCKAKLCTCCPFLLAQLHNYLVLLPEILFWALYPFQYTDSRFKEAKLKNATGPADFLACLH